MRGTLVPLFFYGNRLRELCANRISLKPQGFNITIAIAIISLFAKAKNITKSRKRESKAVFLSALFSLCVFIASFAFV